MSRHHSLYPNRTLCEVLQDMRECYKTYNFSPMLALIEEVQILGNRMEAGLSDQSNIRDLNEKRSKMNQELNKLQQKLDKMSIQATGSIKR